MTKIELEESRHGTQQIERTKTRRTEFDDKVNSFESRMEHCVEFGNRYFVNIESENLQRFERFRFCEADYTKILEAMLRELGLPALLEANKYMATLIANTVNELETKHAEAVMDLAVSQQVDQEIHQEAIEELRKEMEEKRNA